MSAFFFCFEPVCKLHTEDSLLEDITYGESAVVQVSSFFMTILVETFFAGQASLAICPEAEQIETDKWTSQYSVGAVPAKYSRFTVEPPPA